VKYGMETDHKNTYKFSNVNEPTVKNMAIAWNFNTLSNKFNTHKMCL
jgi:hypothetical protein